MSDADLRDLERTWRESGSAPDKARWLQARLRQGELAPARLALATFARDPGALALAEGPGGQAGDALVAAGFSDDAWAAWAGALVELGWEAAYRAGLADLRHKQELLEAAIGGDPDAHGHLEACRTVLARRAEALEDWVLAGGPQGPAPDLGVDFALHGILPGPGDVPLLAWAYDAGLQRSVGLARGVTHGVDDLGSLSLFLGWSYPPRRDQDPLLLARVEAELAAWALGTSDPLRLRLERLEIASPCHIGWDQLAGEGPVRLCDQCHLRVYDLSALDAAAARALVREREGRVCVRLLRRPDGHVQTRDCAAGLQQKLAPYQLPSPPMMGRIRSV